jgi:cytochrome c oxidase subunit 2
MEILGKEAMKTIKRALMGVLATSGLLFAGAALAVGDVPGGPAVNEINLQPPVTKIAEELYSLHTFMLILCTVIFIGVFAVMFYSIFAHRKSKGHKASNFHESTTVEIIWTIVPFVIVVLMALPATKTVVAMKDTTNADVTIKVTGYQWKWRYDYVDYKGKGVDRVGFVSKLEESSDRTRQLKSNLDPAKIQVDGYQTYLLDVDKPLVVPVGTKIRFIIVGGDVIHSWWVPALGWKMDAIPGIANAAWTKIKEPGVYRGQCAELCGQDHGFMPIVVKAVPKAEFEQWLATQEDQAALQKAAATAQNAPAPVPQG